MGWIKHLDILLTSSKNAMQEFYFFNKLTLACILFNFYIYFKALQYILNYILELSKVPLDM